MRRRGTSRRGPGGEKGVGVRAERQGALDVGLRFGERQLVVTRREFEEAGDLWMGGGQELSQRPANIPGGPGGGGRRAADDPAGRSWGRGQLSGSSCVIPKTATLGGGWQEAPSSQRQCRDPSEEALRKLGKTLFILESSLNSFLKEH